MRSKNVQAHITNDFVIMANINNIDCFLKFRNTEDYCFSIVTDIKKADHWPDKQTLLSVLKMTRQDYRKNDRSYSKRYFLKKSKPQEVARVEFTVVHKI